MPDTVDNPGQHQILIDYPPSAASVPRWNPHPGLERIVARGHGVYRSSLETLAGYEDEFRAIAYKAAEPHEPSWRNPYLPPLDSGAIYAFLRSRDAARYFEIGSGNSTQFAARARRDGGLQTEIVSLDPNPRAEVDALCDRVVRSPLETADLSIFAELREGDVLFLDGSHRVFMNSDATVFFLEVLPGLAPGVLVGIHDIYLPYDYPETFSDRYYSEQYLLAAYLLAETPALATVLPAFYVVQHERFRSILEPLWEGPPLDDFAMHGGAYWLETRGAGRAGRP